MPGKVIRRLSGLLNWMDSNLNLLVSVILNGLIMFNIHLLVAVERWRITYRKQVPVWFSVLAEFDALSSLGTFSFNHPDYIFPEPVTHGFAFMATDIGHPLIPAGTCVTNNIEIRGWDQFCIITGANMSGKSTFLRTVGVNYLLAMIGAPVFASNLIFYPIELHSSIRTNDSLAKRESYFYAELRRLKEIIDELEQGKEKLILLDEILKGTNSSDKQTGSIALIRQLMKYKLVGMFATHDLALGNLISHYPDQIQNLCFEIQITDDRMEIDYKLIPGVCRNLNASYLMKNMGIILDDKATEKA
jgi:DNA mismatch repair ATPase MutS